MGHGRRSGQGAPRVRSSFNTRPLAAPQHTAAECHEPIDLGSKHMLLKEGIGWGYMPEPMVREDIAAGRLIQLHMPEYKDGFIRLHAIYRSDTPPGPAGSWLIARFVAQAEGAAEATTGRTIISASRDRRKRSAGANTSTHFR
jgi:DNA-binding transcriptional LysR family regulator